jgi:hypothetical protein
MQPPADWASTTEWTIADLDQYGTYMEPTFAHSRAYMVRDLSRLWCEAACERGDGALARRLAERHGRASARLAAWTCAGCAICPQRTN